MSYELMGSPFHGDNESIATGTREKCLRAFAKLSDEVKNKYYFISLQHYDDKMGELLDDETLWSNTNSKLYDFLFLISPDAHIEITYEGQRQFRGFAGELMDEHDLDSEHWSRGCVVDSHSFELGVMVIRVK